MTDQGETWLVEGSYQEPDRLPGTFSWYIVVQKYDSKVLKLGHRMPMEIPDEVKEIIAKAKRDRQ